MDDERERAAGTGDAEVPEEDLADATRLAEGDVGEVPAPPSDPGTSADPDLAAIAVPLPDGEDAGDGADALTAFQPSHADYTTPELLEQAQGNAQALLLATVGFLNERGVPAEEWAAAIGRRFARAWGEPQPWDADEFLDAMLTNFRSLGAEVVAADLGPERAEATVAGFPSPEHCALFGVDRTAAAAFYGAAAAIAAERGLDWTWDLDGDRTRFVASRRAG